uniref:Uncharacterized protein n=1 Tax=Plectus sambesii TaxID=2011161 RepID=A0A914XT25_9BILA
MAAEGGEGEERPSMDERETKGMVEKAFASSERIESIRLPRRVGRSEHAARPVVVRFGGERHPDVTQSTTDAADKPTTPHAGLAAVGTDMQQSSRSNDTRTRGGAYWFFYEKHPASFSLMNALSRISRPLMRMIAIQINN